MKKKMIVLIAFIYIASMLFCGDGVGKKFVEEKFPHLTYSDKECNDSKKKELRIVEDEDTAGGILSYEELAAMENENASVRNNMLPDTDQLAFVDEAEKNGELAELEEQQNSRADLNAHIAEIRRVLQAARDDAVNGLINRDFVQKYIDRIFVTVDNDKIQLQIKLFTSESTMRYLEKLERRSGHTFKKMIESYEQNMANQG